jgi:hypothetical protein
VNDQFLLPIAYCPGYRTPWWLSVPISLRARFAGICELFHILLEFFDEAAAQEELLIGLGAERK